MRPINSIVDASNYVMLELGQPTHPYDLDRLGGHGLLVRRARPGETIVTLDDEERRLGRAVRGQGAAAGPGGRAETDDLLICDAEGTPVGLAGIMGGASSEISPTSSRVLLEVAHFNPMAVAGTARPSGSAHRGVGALRAGHRSGGARAGRSAGVRAGRGRGHSRCRRGRARRATRARGAGRRSSPHRPGQTPCWGPISTTMPSPATWRRSASTRRRSVQGSTR